MLQTLHTKHDIMLHCIYFLHCVESSELFKIFRIKCIHVPVPNIRFIVSILGLLCAVIVPFLSRMIAMVYCTQLFSTGMSGPNQHLEIRIWS